MDDYARKILNEGWATVARTRNVRVEHRDHDSENDDKQPGWLKRQAERQHRRQEVLAERRQAEARAIEQRQAAASVDARIAEALDPLTEAVGAVIAQERRAHRDELGKLKSEFGLRLDALVAEIDLVRRGFADRSDVDRDSGGTVIEVPQFLERKINAG